jgi:hypothetical protein
MAYRLAELRYLIRSWDAGDDRFSEIIECALAVWPLGLDDLADQIQVSRPTIRRWIRGANLPHPRLRKIIVEMIRQKLLS